VTHNQLLYQAYLEGARDVHRAVACIRMAVHCGQPLADVFRQLRKNRPEMFGPRRAG
jgi:hypothetical protein